MGVPIWLIKSDDIRKPVLSKYNPQLITLDKPISFYAGIELDPKMMKKVKDDAALAHKFSVPTRKNYKVAISEVCTLYRSFDNKHLKGWAKLDKKAREKERDKLSASVKSALERNADFVFKDAEKELKSWLKARKSADRYKSKCVFKVVMGTLGVAGGTLGAVTAVGGAVASGGAGAPAAALAILGAYRALVGLGKEIHSQAKSIDTVDKELRKNLTLLLKRYQTTSKTKVGGRELGAAALNQFFAVEVSNIGKCGDQTNHMGKLLNVLRKKTSEYGKGINKILDGQHDLAKAMQFWEKQKKRKDLSEKSKKEIKKRADKIEAKMKKSVDTTVKSLGKLTDIMSQIEKMDKRLKIYKGMLQLLKGMKPGWLKYAAGMLKFTDLVIAAATLNVTEGIASMDIEKLVEDVTSLGGEAQALLEDQIM